MNLSATAKWISLALLGLAISAIVAVAASNLVSRQIGIASESISAGDALAPAVESAARQDAPRGNGNGNGAPAVAEPDPRDDDEGSGSEVDSGAGDRGSAKAEEDRSDEQEDAREDALKEQEDALDDREDAREDALKEAEDNSGHGSDD